MIHMRLLAAFGITLVLVNVSFGEEGAATRDINVSKDDAAVVTRAGSDDPQTRLITDNPELNAGIGGFILGGGAALLAGHLLKQKEKNDRMKKCYDRYNRMKRDDAEVKTRLFGLFEDDDDDYYCPPPPPSYHHGSSPYRPPSHHGSYRPPSHHESSYRPPSHHGSYRPPSHHESSYRPPAHHESTYRPPSHHSSSYKTPTSSAYRPPHDSSYRPSHNAGYRPPSPHDDYRPSSHRPYQSSGSKYDQDYRVPHREDYRPPHYQQSSGSRPIYNRNQHERERPIYTSRPSGSYNRYDDRRANDDGFDLHARSNLRTAAAVEDESSEKDVSNENDSHDNGNDHVRFADK